MAKQFEQPDQGPSHEEIAQRAYTLFEKNGRAPGHEMEHWLQAEAQLMADRKAKPQTRQQPETRQHSNGSAKSASRQPVSTRT